MPPPEKLQPGCCRSDAEDWTTQWTALLGAEDDGTTNCPLDVSALWLVAKLVFLLLQVESFSPLPDGSGTTGIHCTWMDPAKTSGIEALYSPIGQWNVSEVTTIATTVDAPLQPLSDVSSASLLFTITMVLMVSCVGNSDFCTTSRTCFQSLNYECGESQSATVQRLKKLTGFNFVKTIGIDTLMLYMYPHNLFLSSLLLCHFLPQITLALFVRNSDGGKTKKHKTNVRGKTGQRFYCLLQQMTFHIIAHAAILTSTAIYNDIKASLVNAAFVGCMLLVPAVLEKMTRKNAQERMSSPEHRPVKWNVNQGSVRSTNRFAAGHWNYYFIGFLLLATPQFANASFTPADKTALKTAVDACLSETGDGSCPIFAASHDNTGHPYGGIGTWDVSSVTSMSYSMYLSFFSISFSFNILNNFFGNLFLLCHTQCS